MPQNPFDSFSKPTTPPPTPPMENPVGNLMEGIAERTAENPVEKPVEKVLRKRSDRHKGAKADFTPEPPLPPQPKNPMDSHVPEPKAGMERNPSEVDFKRAFKEKTETAEKPSFDDIIGTENIPKKKRSWWKIVLAILAVLTIMVGGFFGVKAFLDKTTQYTPAPAETEITTTTGETDGTQGVEEITNNPVQENMPEGIPTPEAFKSDIVAVNQTIISSSSELKVDKDSGFEVNSTTGCTVENLSDYCFVSVGQKDNAKYSVFFMESILSGVFNNATDFEKIEIPGSPYSAVLSVVTGEDKTPLVLMADKNGSAWMVTLPINKTMDDAKELAKAFTVQDAGTTKID